MRRGRAARAAAANEEPESVFVSMTDLLVGVVFIFIILLAHFASTYSRATDRLIRAEDPLAIALAERSAQLTPVTLEAELDRAAGVLCVPAATLGVAVGGRDRPTRRCFSFNERIERPKATSEDLGFEARMTLVSDLGRTLQQADAPVIANARDGHLAFDSEVLFAPNSDALTPEGRRVAGEVAAALARTLPCYGFGGDQAVAARCKPTPKVEVVNVLSTTGFDAFTPEGRAQSSLALARSVAFHRALTQAEPSLATIRTSAMATGAQPLLRVATAGQSLDGGNASANLRRIIIAFDML